MLWGGKGVNVGIINGRPTAQKMNFFIKENFIFCAVTPDLSDFMNLAVMVDTRDHNPGHPKIQNKFLFGFESVECACHIK